MSSTVYGSITITDVTDGENGPSLYAWYVYTNNKENKSEYSLDSEGKEYMGVAANQATPLESLDQITDIGIFSWSQVSIKVTEQIEQYYKTNSKDTPSSEDSDWLDEERAWVEIMPNPWPEPNSGDNTKYYIWKRQKTFWSNNTVTYVGLQLLSDYEIVTALAKNDGISVGEWCKGKGVTIIDGATIMAGTVEAAQIAADAITADKLDTDAITSRNYYIKENGEYIKDENGQLIKSGVGSKLNLANGTWDSAHFKIDEQGKVAVTSGSFSNQAKSSLIRKDFITHNGVLVEDNHPSYRIIKDPDLTDYETKISFENLSVGTEFILSYRFQVALGTSASIGGSLTGLEISECKIDDEEINPSLYSGAGIGISNEEHTATLGLKITDEDAELGVKIVGTDDSGTGSFVYILQDIKIEEETGVNGNYSWSFSPEEGMQMWDGPVSATPVLKVDSDGLRIKGSGEFTGDITASKITGSTFTNQKETFKIDGAGNIEGAKITGSSIEVKNGGEIKFSVTKEGKLTANTGSIAGWSINEDSLKSADDQIALYSKDQENDVVVAGHTAKDWRIASTNFGVTSAGKVYATDGNFTGHIEATSGKIGGLSIEQVEIAANNTGINLISKNHLTAVSCTIDSSTTQSIQITGVNTQNTSVIRIAGDYAAGKYTFNATGSKSNKYFRILFSKNYDGNCLENGYYGGLGYPFYKEVTVPVTFDFKEPTSIGLVMLNQYGNQTISGLKLEKGDKASAWTPAPEDTLASNVSNSYSWKFSPTEGIKMWKGAQTTEPIFKVDNNGLYVKGNGEFSGKITANSGEIGNWSIENGGTGTGNNILLNRTGEKGVSGISTGMASLTGNNFVAFWAGCPFSYTPWEYNALGGDYTTATPFYVTNSGYMHATSGDIAGWTINKNSLTKGNLGSNGIHLYAQTDYQTNSNVGDYFGAKEDEEWMLGIGSNFGVTDTGVVYCNDINIQQGYLCGNGSSSDSVASGWEIGNGYLSHGDIGNTGIHLFTKNQNEQYSIGNLGSTNAWRLMIANKFGVDADGKLYAHGAKISGTIIADGGNIAGWQINSDCLIKYKTNSSSLSPTLTDEEAIIQPSGTTGSYTIAGKNQTGWSLGIGSNFGVDKTGALYCTNLNASGGTIGSWTITSTENTEISLKSGDLGAQGSVHLYSFYPNGQGHSVGTSGNLTSWRLLIGPNFGVNSAGTLYATGANISGNITGSKITGSSIEIKENNTTNFSVTNTGYLTANKGSIAGWSINEDSLTTGVLSFGVSGIHMYPKGRIYDGSAFGVSGETWMLGVGDGFGVSSDGTLYAKKGKIGTINIGNIAAQSGENIVNGNGFGWNLSTDGFYLNKYSNNNPEQVFYVNENEAKVGGFNITKNNLSTGSGSGYISLQTSGDNYEYTPAEYIESNGNQYIDTGVKPTPNTVTEITFTPTGGLEENAIFGSKWAAAGYFLMLYKGVLRWHSQGKVYDTITVSTGDRLVCKCSTNGIEVNGIAYNTPTDDYGYSLDAANNIQILGKMDSTGNKEGIGRIESCRIYESGKIIKNLIPAFKDGEYGLYDLCFGQFYKNKNSNYRFNGQINFEQAKSINLGGNSYTRLDYIQNNGSNNYIEISGLDIVKKNGFIVEVEFEPIQNTTSSPDNRCCLFSNYSSSNQSIGSNISLELHQNNLARGFIDNGDRLSSGVAGTVANQRNKVVYTVAQQGSPYSINCLVNGQLTTGSPFSPSSSDDTWRGPFRIFVDNYNGGRFETFKIPFKLYSIKILSNGKKLFHGLPALNNSGVPGLIDLSSGQFFTTASGSAFTYGEYEMRSGKVIFGTGDDSGNSYRTLEYIESSGTQYINTDVEGDTGNLTIMAKYNILAYTQYAGIFGNYVNEPYNCWRMILTETNDDECFVNVNTVAGGGSTRLRMPKNTVHEILLDKDKIVINNQTTPITLKTSGTDNGSKIAIFSQKVGTAGAAMRLYSFKILDEGSLLRDYVPVIKNEDEYGLYDLVGQKFYGNEGTGTFTGKDYVSEYHAIYLGSVDPEIAPFSVTNTGTLYCSNIQATGGSIGDWKVGAGGSDGKILFKRVDGNTPSTSGMAALNEEGSVAFWAGCPEKLTPWEYNATGKDYSTVTPFFVTNQGFLHASSGDIGPFSLNSSGLFFSQNNQTFSMSNTGLTLTGSPFSARLGNLSITHNETDGTALSTNGKLILRGDNNTEIQLMSDNTTNSKTYNVTANFRAKPHFILNGFIDGLCTVHCWGLSEAPLYPFEVKVWYQWSDGEAGEVSTWYTPANYGERDLVTQRKDKGIFYGYWRFKTFTRDWSDYYDAADIQNNETDWDGSVIGSASQSQTDDNIITKGNLVSSSTSYNLGLLGREWSYVYSVNGCSDSDRKLKDNILDMDEKFSKKLIEGLQPKSYKFKIAATPRTHYGFVAQDVEELLKTLGTTTDEVGLVCKSIPDEPDGESNRYALNYTNLIAPMVCVIQQLLKRVAEPEEKLLAYESRISALEKEIKNLKNRENSDII